MIAPTNPPSRTEAPRERRRPPWRQRLIDAEGGIKLGLRGDSIFFAYFFGVSILVPAGFVLGLSLMQWTVVILALTLVLSAEMFHQVLKALWKAVGHHLAEPAAASLRLAMGAVFVAFAGAAVVIGLVFGQQLLRLLTN